MFNLRPPLQSVCGQSATEAMTLVGNVGRYYEVLDGAAFEDKFNALRKVRQRHKNGATERPFSRMHNFFIL